MSDIPGTSKNLDGGSDGFTIVTRRKIDQGAKVKNEETNFRFENTRNASQKRSEFLKTPATSSNQGSPSTSTDMASPGASHMSSNTTSSPAVSTVNAQSTEVRRKTKKKKESKEARLRRREEEKFKALYGSKDSRIQVMSTALFAKIQANQFGKPKTPESKPIEDSFSLPIWPTTDPDLVMFPKPVWVKQNNFSSGIMKSEFPELGTSSASNSKNNQSSQGKTDSRLENKNVGPSSTTSTLANHENETHLPEEPSSIDKTPRTSTERATFSAALKKEKPAIPEIDTPPPAPPKLNKKKPSKTPLIISIDTLLSAKKNSASKQSTQAKLKASRKPTRTNEKIQPAGNVLDSSGIKVMHRGKMRETPKKKKPTKLKRAILLSRQLRKQLAISENQNLSDLNEGDEEKLENLLTLASNLSLIERNSISNMPVAERCLFKPKSEGNGRFVEEQEKQPEVKQEDDSEAFTEDFDSNFTPPQEVTLKPDYFHDLVENSLKPEAPVEAERTEADASAPLSPEIIEAVKSQMHSRKFRKYCDMYTSKEMHGLVIGLLKQLHHFQDKLYKTDLLKYKLKKRYVHGIREISNFMSINKIQMIILAPDIESNKNVEGGLDDLLEGLLTTAKSKNVPVIFSGNRYVLGKPICMKTPVSAIGILDHQGAEDLYRKMLEEATQLRLKYQEEFNTRVQAIQSQSLVNVHRT